MAAQARDYQNETSTVAQANFGEGVLEAIATGEVTARRVRRSWRQAPLRPWTFAQYVAWCASY